MNPMLSLIFVIIISYIVGSFPTAILISKVFFGFDIREKGSGNMGSTNAFRVLGWKWGVVVQSIDISKGLIAILIISPIFAGYILKGDSPMFSELVLLQFIAGAAAVLGHIFTIFAGFRGGKGVNTALGMLFGIAPIDAGIALICFTLALFFSGYISLGSISGSIGLPLSMFARHNFFGANIPGYNIIIIPIAVLAAFLIYAHKTNIVRIFSGTENKFENLHLFKFRKK